MPREVDYAPECTATPPALRVLEQEIDRAVGIERWIGTNDARRACFVEKTDCASFVGIEAPPATP